MDQEYPNGTRSRYRAKRKKTNLILNSLIALVIILILAVGFSIFAGNDDAAPKPADKVEADSKTAGKESGESGGTPSENNNGETVIEDNSSSADDSASDDTANEEKDKEDAAADQESSEQAEPVVTDGGSSENVKRTIENPAWKPVGTSQTGAHEVVTDKDSPDWQEMLNALAYAIETDSASMTTWWLERDRSTEDGAIGTVSAKGSDQTYRVYIQWVDGQGYKPVKVEELSSNDKR